MLGWIGAWAGEVTRRAVLAAVAGLLMLAGMGFVTAAATVALGQAYGTPAALLIVGGGLVVLGLIAFVRARAAGPRARARAQAVPLTALAEAFAVGMAAAQATRR